MRARAVRPRRRALCVAVVRLGLEARRNLHAEVVLAAGALHAAAAAHVQLMRRAMRRHTAQQLPVGQGCPCLTLCTTATTKPTSEPPLRLAQERHLPRAVAAHELRQRVLRVVLVELQR
eukprot:103042-Chlamydomonas_euryale.AAC.2